MYKLPNPPDTSDSEFDWREWLDQVYRYVKPVIQPVNDTDAEIGTGTTHLGITALTAQRTMTFPDSGKLEDGDTFLVLDEVGAANANNVLFLCQGSDTLNGAASGTLLSSDYGFQKILKRGTNKFFKI